MTNSGTYYVVVTNMAGWSSACRPWWRWAIRHCWLGGITAHGQLGNGTTSNTNLPIIVASNVVAGAGGNAYSLFVKTDGTLWAMGYNFFGQLGNGTSRDTNTPINVASNVVAVAAGQYHSLFVKTDGTLWAMGLNADGQLGNGTMINANTANQCGEQCGGGGGGILAFAVRENGRDIVGDGV